MRQGQDPSTSVGMTIGLLRVILSKAVYGRVEGSCPMRLYKEARIRSLHAEPYGFLGRDDMKKGGLE